MARTAAASTATTRDSARMATTTATTTAAESTRTMASTRAARQGRPRRGRPRRGPRHSRRTVRRSGLVRRSTAPSTAAASRPAAPAVPRVRPSVLPPARPTVQIPTPPTQSPAPRQLERSSGALAADVVFASPAAPAIVVATVVAVEAGGTWYPRPPAIT